MDADEIADVVTDIIDNGPNRVLVNSDYSVKPIIARNHYKVTPDIIFIRDDGWSLGSPKSLEYFAYTMWEEEWEYFMNAPDWFITPIEEYEINKM